SIGDAATLPDLRAFYNGYVFGGRDVYNPWSVLSFLESGDKVLRPYWVRTSSDDLLRDLLIRRAKELGSDMEELLRRGVVEKPIDESVSLREAVLDGNAIWSFLLFSGYLTAVETRSAGVTQIATLEIPNEEVMATYEGIFS